MYVNIVFVYIFSCRFGMALSGKYSIINNDFFVLEK